jgi:hypothetical protein
MVGICINDKAVRFVIIGGWLLLGLVSKNSIALMLLFYNCIILNIGHIHYFFTCTYRFEYIKDCS